MTYLHKYVLILHHERIGVDVARERFGLAGLCTVLQLAGYIQGLCPQKDRHKHTDSQVKPKNRSRYQRTKKGYTSYLLICLQPAPCPIFSTLPEDLTSSDYGYMARIQMYQINP